MASLGTIQIHLQRTSDGIVARVVTEHAEAAQTLAQNGDDLRRSLQQNGTHLLRLDIESSDQQRSEAQEETSPTSTDGGNGDQDDAGTDPMASTPALDAGLASATLVNVLA